MEQTKPNDLKFASVWKRMIAFAIDIFIVVALFSLLIVFFNWVLQLPVEYSLFEGRGMSVKMTDYVKENFVKLVVIYSLAKLSVIVPYFACLESSRRQATLGKMLLGIEVGDFEGKRISFGKALLRFFGRLISGQILLIGYLMAFFTEKKQALHDFLAGTFVFEKLESKTK
ncbi:MAG: RDD family protein [Acidobacteriota bacterium]|nr:RDD family protein [Acidobacteriota bacterium]